MSEELLASQEGLFFTELLFAAYFATRQDLRLGPI